MPSAKSLTWIHLSDLHFGHGKEATTRFDQKVVTSAIVRDAEMVASELGAPDFVFVTGDVAFSASAEKEYPAAGEWLAKLLAVLKIGPDRVLMVPGNHDVDRKKAGDGRSRFVHKALRADPEEVNTLLEKANEMEDIWPKLAAYQKFAGAYGSPEITPAQPFWTKRLSCDLGPVEVLGLNTALLSFDGGDSPKNLALGAGQIHRAGELLEPGALLFVLQHHPPTWLCDGGQLLAFLKDWPHLLFCGHVHEQHGFVALPFASRGNVALVAGAGHGDANEAGEHAYAWGQLSGEGLAYYPRAWLARERCFKDQQINPPKEREDYTPKLGKFVRYPRALLPQGLAKWLEESVAYIGPATATDHVALPVPAPAVAPTAPVVATFDPALPYFSVPFRAKGDQVIGRRDALLQVRTQLEKGRATAIGQTAAFVGLGGLGKTQLAVEYAHTYRDQYPGGVYWFNADGDLDGQLTRLAVDARWVSPMSEPRYMLEIARRRIRTRSHCLVVFDNVEELEAIRELLPEPPANPHLLITSRKSLADFDPVPIDRLPDEQSLELLCSESRRSLETVTDREAALRIARQLEGLPLALELAGAYLNRARAVSWVAYADLLEAEGTKARGLYAGKLSSFTKHDADLFATLHIDEELFVDSPLLREALDLLAWSGSASMGRGLVASLLGASEAAVEVALGEAETLRILKREQGASAEGQPRFLMHRLVREVRRAEVPVEKEPARWLAVMQRLGDWFSERREEFANLPSYEAEIDHLEVWQRNAGPLGYAREAARLLWLRGYPHHHRGQYQRAHDLVQEALALFERSALVDPELEAHLRADLGGTLLSLGELREGFAQSQKALDIRRRLLGEKHPDTASSIGSVGIALARLGDHRKALEYHQKALDVRRQILGEKHPDTASSLSNVGSSLDDLGDHRRALEYKQKALAIQRDLLGEKHPATAISLNNIGYSLEKLGEDRKAFELTQRSLAIRREVLGEKHPATVNSLGNLGAIYDALGDLQRALEYGQRALDLRCEVLGETHPDTASSYGAVGNCLVNLGQNAPGVTFLKKALAIQLGALGDRHPDTTRSWRNIVQVLLKRRTPNAKMEALALVESDLKRFPGNPTLKRLKNEILGKHSAKPTSKTSKPGKR